MVIYKTKRFAKWAAGESLSDDDLRNAVTEIESGLIDADLGGGVIKKRIALPGRGKSGGARTLLAYRSDDKSVFIHGFAKNDKDNISKKELQALKKLAGEYFGLSVPGWEKALKDSAVVEVKYEAEEKDEKPNS